MLLLLQFLLYTENNDVSFEKLILILKSMLCLLRTLLYNLTVHTVNRAVSIENLTILLKIMLFVLKILLYILKARCLY